MVNQIIEATSPMFISWKDMKEKQQSKKSRGDMKIETTFKTDQFW